VEVTMHYDFSGNLVIYSQNYLFDKKLLIINSKEEMKNFLEQIPEQQLKDLKSGWMIKTNISQEYKEIYFE
jgi:hypothetical protein